MRSFPLYVTVALSGAAVLALEILGTRILGPFYGVSLFLWSALISVTLAALSIGYAVGGRLADRRASATGLGTIVGLAGIWVLLVPFLHRPVLAAAEPLGLRAAVLLSATLLFAPPLTLLGMVAPYAIRLKASRLDHVGRTAGDLYAVSTVASVVSALLMGFVLIPSLGVQRLTYSVGLALLAAAGAALLGERGSARRAVAGILVLVAAGAGIAAIPADAADPGHGLLAVRQSPYAEIRVLDRNGARHLLVDGGIHAKVVPRTWRSVHPYVPAVDALKCLFDEPGTMLLLGLGAGSIAKSWAADGWKVDAVEIDPVMPGIAREFFGLKPEDCTVHLDDARRFLERTDRRWDVIVVDAFGSSSIPFHLATREAFALMARHLEDGGVLGMNLMTIGWHDPLVAELAATLAPSFDRVLALPTAEPPDQPGNVILVAASGRPLAFDESSRLRRPMTLLDRPVEHWYALQTNHAWDNRFEPVTAGIDPVTDDRNPLDLRGEAINRGVRKALHAYFRNDGESW